MPDKITKQDERLLAAKAAEGSISEGDTEIEDVVIEFDRADFPALKADEKGDKVLVVLAGYVTELEDDAVLVEFNRASVVHGRMTTGQKGKVMRLEDTLEGKEGVKNKYALARYMVLKGRKK